MTLDIDQTPDGDTGWNYTPYLDLAHAVALRESLSEAIAEASADPDEPIPYELTEAATEPDEIGECAA